MCDHDVSESITRHAFVYRRKLASLVGSLGVKGSSGPAKTGGWALPGEEEAVGKGGGRGGWESVASFRPRIDKDFH